MKVLCLGHAMKETLPVRDARRCLEEATRAAGHEVSGSFCLSDGGDGFLEACEDALGKRCRRVVAQCTGPLGERLEADFLLDEERGLAVIETARACGLALVPPAQRDVVAATSMGVGELLLAAAARGARQVLVGVGGTASCDGGAGMLAALRRGTCAGAGLAAWRAAVPGQIVICSDVTNPLLGPQGAAAVFAPQKGASPQQVALLEVRLTDLAGELEAAARTECGDERRFHDMPGAGAGGGLGFALMVLGGEMRPGAVEVLQLLGIEEQLRACDVMVTSEGRFDATSLQGKAPWAAARAAVAAGVRAIIACGSADAAAARGAENEGIRVVECCGGVAVEERRARAPERLVHAVTRTLTELAATPAEGEGEVPK